MRAHAHTESREVHICEFSGENAAARVVVVDCERFTQMNSVCVKLRAVLPHSCSSYCCNRHGDRSAALLCVHSGRSEGVDSYMTESLELRRS